MLGGLFGCPVNGIKKADSFTPVPNGANEQLEPPPDKVTVAFPDDVAVGPVYVVSTGESVAVGADGAPVPAELIALAVHV